MIGATASPPSSRWEARLSVARASVGSRTGTPSEAQAPQISIFDAS